MKETFRHREFNAAQKTKIDLCNEIIEAWQAEGLRLTLRQLYYQLVIRNAIVNEQSEYRKLSFLLSEARLAGAVDWDAIEDRVRAPYTRLEFSDLRDLVRAAEGSYRLERWRGQENYVELWVEKDALANVLEPPASEFHVTLMVNRGYSSQSAMYAAAERIKGRGHGTNAYVFYLGDHDPSGEDMVRDIRKRFETFRADEDLKVSKIALTTAQVRQYKLPPNPTKWRDPRADAYIAEHGETCWEVDALPPRVLAQLVRKAFAEVVDVKKMAAIKRVEERDKKAFLAATEDLIGGLK